MAVAFRISPSTRSLASLTSTSARRLTAYVSHTCCRMTPALAPSSTGRASHLPTGVAHHLWSFSTGYVAGGSPLSFLLVPKSLVGPREQRTRCDRFPQVQEA